MQIYFLEVIGNFNIMMYIDIISDRSNEPVKPTTDQQKRQAKEEEEEEEEQHDFTK